MHEKQIMKLNLRLLANYMGRNELATAMGYDNTNYLNQMLAGHAPIGDSAINRITKINDRYSITWLRASHHDEWKKEGVLSVRYYRRKLQPGSSDAEDRTTITGKVPLVSWSDIPADHNDTADSTLDSTIDIIGIATENEQTGNTDYTPTIINNSYGPNTYSVLLDSDSMCAPTGDITYKPGDVIIVDPDQSENVKSGDRVIALLDNALLSMDARVQFKVYVKDAGKEYLKPLNPLYDPVHEPFKVIGVIVARITI